MMLDHREYMREYERRAQQIVRDHERLKLWSYPRQPSRWRQIIAGIGNMLVMIGTRLQTTDQYQHTRQRLA